MRPLAVVLAVLLGAPARADELDAGTIIDGGTAGVYRTVTGVLMLVDGGVEEVGTGCWLDERRCIAAGKLAAGDTAERDALERERRDLQNAPVPSWKTALIAAGVSSLTFLLGVLVGRTTAPPPPQEK